jgi:predicted anti-sigma-YlaC factor YlaD
MCENARKAASLQIDGELSEVGSARLEAHLRECEACAVYARELAAITMRMRSAPLEQPALQVPLRRAHPARTATAAGAAAAVAAVLLVAAGVLGTARTAGSPTSAADTPAQPSLGQEVAIQHILALERYLAPDTPHRVGRLQML